MTITDTYITDTYNAKTLADARAAALQGIETFAEDGFDMVQIEATRTAKCYRITVTYQKDAK